MKRAVSIACFLTAATAFAQPAMEQLAHVTFATGSARLPAAYENDVVMTWAVTHPDGLVVVAGHGDVQGDSQSNAQLSLARAQLVRDELERSGINPQQIVIAVYGAGAGNRVVIWGSETELN